MIVKNTHELEAGDIVLSHGMQIQLAAADRTEYIGQGGSVVVSWPGRVLNADDVREAGIVPPSFIADGTWQIQGNELARWEVLDGSLVRLSEV